MTPEQKKIYEKAAELGSMPDELNPIFLFSTTHPALLTRIAAGEFDPVVLAKQELTNRGLDLNGQWALKPRPKDKKAINTYRKKR